MEQLFLLAGTYFFVVVPNPAVCPGLPVVVPFESFVKQLMKNCSPLAAAFVAFAKVTKARLHPTWWSGGFACGFVGTPKYYTIRQLSFQAISDKKGKTDMP